MTDPERWLVDPTAPGELRDVLRHARRARGLDGPTRARLHGRLARASAAPLAAATWFGVKTAAALGIAGGVSAAGILAVAQNHRFPSPPELELPVARASRTVAGASSQPAALPEPDVAELVPESPPSIAPPQQLRASPAVVPALSPSASLLVESQLLEAARQGVASNPTAALARLREHATRFPEGQLAAERHLIEVEALDRVGRRSEARALARRLLAAGSDGLYVQRIQRLLEKMDAP